MQLEIDIEKTKMIKIPYLKIFNYLKKDLIMFLITRTCLTLIDKLFLKNAEECKRINSFTL